MKCADTITRLAALLFAATAAAAAAAADTATPAEAQVLADSVGYVTGQPGRAYVLSAQKLDEAAIVLIDSRGKRRPVKTSAVRDDALAAWVYPVDVPTAGGDAELQLQVGEQPPQPISVRRAPYEPLLKALLRSYSLQRCGVAIDDHASGVAHAACHLNDARRSRADLAGPEGGDVPATGGWHDAGDYGKYVASTATVVLELLSRYERYPALFATLDFDIPESGDRMPDLLDEMRVGLDWMLTLQRPDGAVYRKLGGRAWPAKLTPDEDRQPRYVYGISSPETAKAAASWALAARVYAPFDPERSARYLAAARLAWRWLDPWLQQIFDFRAGDDSGSGPYMANAVDTESTLTHDRDDRLAAAIELYLSTGEDRYARVVDQLLPDYQASIFEWKDVGTGSMTSLLWHPRASHRPAWRQQAAAKLQARAASALRQAESSSFQFANPHIVWGSVKMTAEEGVLMLAADRLKPDPRLRRAAWQQLHFALGANPLGQTFVTGFGAKPVQHVSHIFLRSIGRSFPGLAVGGPNEREQSNIAPRNRGLLSYADDDRSYATNEYAIDYDSALIALLVDLQQAGSTPYAGLRLAPLPESLPPTAADERGTQRIEAR